MTLNSTNGAPLIVPQYGKVVPLRRQVASVATRVKTGKVTQHARAQRASLRTTRGSRAR